jgi:dihydrofolate reductase
VTLYVVTGRELPRATEHVETVSRDPGELARELRRRHGHVWLVGGTRLARSVLRAGGVDEIRLTVVPVLLGEGIHLFDGTAGAHDLTLRDAVARAGGLVERQYAVTS